MLLCSDGSFYVGVTSNLEKRAAEHDLGIDRRCYTFKRRPLKLVHCSDFHDIYEAISWEKQLKRWSRAKKQALIENDWPRISELAMNYRERFCRSLTENALSLSHPSTGSG
jgi:putative endonuclease